MKELLLESLATLLKEVVDVLTDFRGDEMRVSGEPPSTHHSTAEVAVGEPLPTFNYLAFKIFQSISHVNILRREVFKHACIFAYQYTTNQMESSANNSPLWLKVGKKSSMSVVITRNFSLRSALGGEW